MANAKKLPSGHYRCLVYAGRNSAGKRIYKSFTAVTKKEAEFLAASWKMNADKDRNATFVHIDEAIERYIESKSNVLSPTTYRTYVSLKDHAFVALADKNVFDLTTEDVQNLVNSNATTYKTASLRLQVTLLVSSVKIFRPDFNANVLYPKNNKKLTYIPTDDDISKILAVSTQEIRRAVMLAAFGSLRIGEVCALTGADIHTDYIDVNKNMVYDMRLKWIVKAPKTAESTRKVYLPKEIIKELKCAKSELVVGVTPAKLREEFKKALKAAGVTQFKFHALRHYHASTLHALGVPEKYIMRRGGWASGQTLQAVYEHPIDSVEQKVNSDIGDYFLSICNTKSNTTPEKG